MGLAVPFRGAIDGANIDGEGDRVSLLVPGVGAGDTVSLVPPVGDGETVSFILFVGTRDAVLFPPLGENETIIPMVGDADNILIAGPKDGTKEESGATVAGATVGEPGVGVGF